MMRETAAERLKRAGLRIIEDTGIVEWRQRYIEPQGACGTAAEGMRARIAVAER
jgi:hypothetical protein